MPLGRLNRLGAPRAEPRIKRGIERQRERERERKWEKEEGYECVYPRHISIRKMG